MNNYAYELSMIDYYAEPVDYYKQCLYLRWTKDESICMFKNKSIYLSPRLYKALFTMAEDTTHYHLFTKDYNPDRAILDNDRKIANRIRKKFVEAGFSSNLIISKEHAGYKINTEILPDSFIITTRK